MTALNRSAAGYRLDAGEDSGRSTMNWITNFVRPKLKSILSTPGSGSPDDLWSKCPKCDAMIFHRELEHSQNVCPNCDHHMYLSPRDRFERLFDGGVYVEVDVPKPIADPLKFRDQKRYADRLRAAQKKTGEAEAMLVGIGEIHRTKFVVAAQDFNFMGGSMGMYVGNAIVAACEKAVELTAPLVLFSAAGGARMQEGILSLMQMPRTTVALQKLKNSFPAVPYIVVLTNPTSGGTSASYAMLGDIHIAEPKALICFAGPRVIEQTIGEKLPEGFQRAEYLLEHGMIDMVTRREKIKDEIVAVARLLMNRDRAITGDLPKQATPRP